MIKSIQTSRGMIIIREANLADAEQFRALRLFALQESPHSVETIKRINLSDGALATD
jgi:hypothetical protein